MNVGYLGYIEITPMSFQPGLRIPYFTDVAAMGPWHDSLSGGTPGEGMGRKSPFEEVPLAMRTGEYPPTLEN